jgi:hypothetical protein
LRDCRDKIVPRSHRRRISRCNSTGIVMTLITMVVSMSHRRLFVVGSVPTSLAGAVEEGCRKMWS